MLNIIINAKEDFLTDEIKKQMVVAINDLISFFIEDNNIKTLNEIIIPDDFSEEITIFQRKYNLPIEHTNSDGGKAVAKTFKLFDGQVVFFDKQQFAGIFMKDDVSISLLFHELSHIYYNEMIRNKYRDMLNRLEISLNILDNLNASSYILWEEYFVSRKLIKYFSNGLNANMDFLISHYEKTEEILKKAVSEYKTNKDIRKIYGIAQDWLVLLAKYIAYPLGMIAGNKENYEKFSKQEYEDEVKSKMPKIYPIWQVLDNIYDHLYQEFPNFNSLEEELSKITEQYIKLYECFNIFLNITEDNRMTLDVE